MNSANGVGGASREDEQAKRDQEHGGADFVVAEVADDEQVDFTGDFLHDVFPYEKEFI
jgi:hypothetical protein